MGYVTCEKSHAHSYENKVHHCCMLCCCVSTPICILDDGGGGIGDANYMYVCEPTQQVRTKNIQKMTSMLRGV